MMDRATKLAILNSMEDSKLTAALDAIGISCGGDEDHYGEGEANKLKTWGETEVSVPETTRGPIANKASLFITPNKPRPVNAMGMSLPGEDEEAMLTAGLL